MLSRGAPSSSSSSSKRSSAAGKRQSSASSSSAGSIYYDFEDSNPPAMFGQRPRDHHQHQSNNKSNNSNHSNQNNNNNHSVHTCSSSSSSGGVGGGGSGGYFSNTLHHKSDRAVNPSSSTASPFGRQSTASSSSSSSTSYYSDRQQQNRFINTTTKKPEVESVVISMSDFDLKGGGGANVPSFDYARNHTAAAAAETSSFQPSAATTGYKSSSSSSSRRSTIHVPKSTHLPLPVSGTSLSPGQILYSPSPSSSSMGGSSSRRQSFSSLSNSAVGNNTAATTSGGSGGGYFSNESGSRNIYSGSDVSSHKRDHSSSTQHGVGSSSSSTSSQLRRLHETKNSFSSSMPEISKPSTTTTSSSYSSTRKSSHQSVLPLEDEQQLAAVANSLWKKTPSSNPSSKPTSSHENTNKGSLSYASLSDNLASGSHYQQYQHQSLSYSPLASPSTPTSYSSSSLAKPKTPKDTTTASSSSATNTANATKTPLSPDDCLHYYRKNLTVYEQKEISFYRRIYYLGSTSIDKIGSAARKTGADGSFDGNLTIPRDSSEQADPPSSRGSTYNWGYDDSRGDYYLIEHDHIAYRYEIISLLGKGSFGQVAKCYDHKLGRYIACKIIRNKKRFEKQGAVEVKVLEKIREEDQNNAHNSIHMLDSFRFRGHLCITFELLGINLYEWLKAGGFRGVNTGVVKSFGIQMLHCLHLMREQKIVHCDLKPENVLLCDISNIKPALNDLHAESSSTSRTSSSIQMMGDDFYNQPTYLIKVIDFGSSCFESERVYTYVQSRFYRSPEVILGINYNVSIDMWSFGCILAELYTGYPLFPGENEQEQLACIMEVKGVPETYYIDSGSRKQIYFDSNYVPKLVANSKGRKRRPGSRPLSSSLKTNDRAFLDFIERCLEWDPSRRITPAEALNHEWIVGAHRSRGGESMVEHMDVGSSRHTSSEKSIKYYHPHHHRSSYQAPPQSELSQTSMRHGSLPSLDGSGNSFAAFGGMTTSSASSSNVRSKHYLNSAAPPPPPQQHSSHHQPHYIHNNKAASSKLGSFPPQLPPISVFGYGQQHSSDDLGGNGGASLPLYSSRSFKK